MLYLSGAAIGMVFKKSIPEKYQDIYFQAVGLFTLLLGIKMSIGISEPLLVVLSLVLGGFIGLRLAAHEVDTGFFFCDYVGVSFRRWRPVFCRSRTYLSRRNHPVSVHYRKRYSRRDYR
jgi:hypothetical protein